MNLVFQQIDGLNFKKKKKLYIHLNVTYKGNFFQLHNPSFFSRYELSIQINNWFDIEISNKVNYFICSSNLRLS